MCDLCVCEHVCVNWCVSVHMFHYIHVYISVIVTACMCVPVPVCDLYRLVCLCVTQSVLFCMQVTPSMCVRGLQHCVWPLKLKMILSSDSESLGAAFT